MAEIQFRGKKIYYEQSGSGVPVVLVHGFGENGNVFQSQVDFLKSNFRVIVPDLPGSGQSEPLDGQPGLEDFAAMIHEIATKEFGDQTFHLFGHSMGGYTTMAFVEKYSDRLHSFGLLHSSAFADTEEKIKSRENAIRFIEEQDGQAFLKTIAPNMFAEETRKKRPQFVQQLLEMTKEISDHVLIQYYKAMIARPDRSSLLINTTLPVLFVIGKHDQAIPYEISLQQCHLPANRSVHILEHAGHMGMWEDTEKVNQALADFLSRFH